jgi:hypothetical protein
MTSNSGGKGRRRGPPPGWSPDRAEAKDGLPPIQRKPKSLLYGTAEWRSFLEQLDSRSKPGWIKIPLSAETLKSGKSPSSVVASFRQLIVRHLEKARLTKKYDRKAVFRWDGDRPTLYVLKLYGLPPKRPRPAQ